MCLIILIHCCLLPAILLSDNKPIWHVVCAGALGRVKTDT